MRITHKLCKGLTQLLFRYPKKCTDLDKNNTSMPLSSWSHRVWSVSQPVTGLLEVTPLVGWAPRVHAVHRLCGFQDWAVCTSNPCLSMAPCMQQIQPSQTHVGDLYCPFRGAGLSVNITATQAAFAKQGTIY